MKAQKIIRYIVILQIAIVMMTASCSQKREAPPLSPDKMQQLLLDIHIAEYYSHYYMTDSGMRKKEKNKDSLAVFYHSILQHYGITLEQFDKAFEWYAMHPEMLDTVYSGVVLESKKLQKKYPYSVTADTVSANRKTDSLRAEMQQRKDSVSGRLWSRRKDAADTTGE